jgi:hypothetical protein
MSRTDKDKPCWVTAEWYTPFHGYHCRYGWLATQYPCDLPENPVRSASAYSWGRSETKCSWVVHHENRYCCRYSPSREDRRLGWWGPDRRAKRDSLKSAVKEYRAAGEVETEPPVRQHTHSPAKGWWD